MRDPIPVSRREFLIRATAAGGGLLLGFHLPWVEATPATEATATAGPVEVNAWVLVHPDETVTIRVARSEMGQGALTALPMLVAEELECDWARVRAEYALASDNLARDQVFGSMSTGGSRSVRDSHEYLRRAGAVARELLVAAAATRLGVAAEECRATGGVVTHGPSGRTLTYGAVATDASRREPPKEVRLKDPAEWRLLGQRVPRLDAREKIEGRPVFGTDVAVPGLRHAAIRACPVFGGRLRGYDEAAIRGRPGVRQVVALEDAVAVVADTWWQAHQALEALPITWDEGPARGVASETLLRDLRAALDRPEAALGRTVGDAKAAIAGAARRVEAEYYAPYLNHATMEPMNATAHVTAGRVEVWAPTQNASATLTAAAEAAGVDPSDVVVHNTLLGGGFGRRGSFQDAVRQAVRIARAVGQPVKLLWSREEDMRHGFYRPASFARLTAALDAEGLPSALQVRVAASSILAGVRPDAVRDGLDPLGLQGFDDLPYAIPHQRLEYALVDAPVPVGFWRSVNHSQNAFFRECFLDEVAHAGKRDPLELRRRLLAEQPLQRAVLETAAAKAGWGGPLPPGHGRGLALHASFGSLCAQVAEVSVEDGRVRVERVVCALDPGHVVNPDTIEAQVESAIAYGLTAVLHGEITLRAGQVTQGNFEDYPLLALPEMPAVETHLVPSRAFWGGVGEPPLPPLGPAVCNALFAATGRRVRALPLRGQDLTPLEPGLASSGPARPHS